MSAIPKRRALLHVGCGRAPLPASFAPQKWQEIRYDIDPAVEPDLVGSICDMSQVADASVDAIFSSHNLEHLATSEVPHALREFLRVLRPGGVAWIIVPDLQSLAERMAAGDLDGELYRSPAGPITVLDVLWGHQASLAAGQQHMAHRTGFSAATLRRRLIEAGFAPVRIERRPEAFEMFATAGRPVAPATLVELFEQGRRHHAAGRWADAEVFYRQALERDPTHWPARLELGMVCHLQGRWDEAIAQLQQAVVLEPRFARTQAALGAFLGMAGRPGEALAHLQRAADLDPASAESHYNLGKAWQEQNAPTAAECEYREALRLDPKHDLARLNLANVLFAQWRRPEGLRLYQEVAARSADLYVSCNLPMVLNFAAEPSDDEVFAAHLEFDRRLIAPLAAVATPHANSRDPDRRLRIGYLSRDFRHHSVRYFLTPVFAHHDHGAFEICCYHFGGGSDKVTDFYRRHADRWIECESWSDDRLAACIRDDAIDILVDLAGYTDRNRLLVVGRKPAPVQVAYLGYPASTGVRTIDYRLSDRWIDPEPPDAPVATSETPLRLAHGYFCYSPLPDSPAVGPLPLERQGHVTFGSLNQATKLNLPLLESWAEIMDRLPSSRLVIQNAGMAAGVPLARVRAEFKRLGIDPSRVDFRPFGKAPSYLETYHDIDIALDSFPYNGGTTTCEALWMGVPVVSRCGGRHVSRLGLSILNQAGLGELVAGALPAYVDTAVALGRDIDRLGVLRATMRERLTASPLMDHAGFTRELEAAYRTIWHRWCEADARPS